MEGIRPVLFWGSGWGRPRPQKKPLDTTAGEDPACLVCLFFFIKNHFIKYFNESPAVPAKP